MDRKGDQTMVANTLLVMNLPIADQFCHALSGQSNINASPVLMRGRLALNSQDLWIVPKNKLFLFLSFFISVSVIPKDRPGIDVSPNNYMLSTKTEENHIQILNISVNCMAELEIR